MPNESKSYLGGWLERLYNLRRDNPGTHERPHKPILLLSIFDLIERKLISRNQVQLTDELVATFRKYFDIVRQGDDRPTIENPFYRLSGDGFWDLIGPEGQPPLYSKGQTSGTPSMKVLRQAFGRFDENLWRLITDPFARHNLRDALIARYFAGHRSQIAALVGANNELTSAQQPLALKEEFEQQRDAAFRKTVLALYDSTCAACGLRVNLNDGFSLVEAAHLIPWEQSKNDNPSNGLALCPNHHRAMDNHLIGPCPHPMHRAGIWRISKRLDERRDSRKDLVSLNQKPVLEPSDEAFYPALESLKWRERQLQMLQSI